MRAIWNVKCPRCHAAIRQVCATRDGAPWFHAARVRAAGNPQPHNTRQENDDA
ncbi:zinc finger domain-containing protein [Nocardia bovistercoris]